MNAGSIIGLAAAIPTAVIVAIAALFFIHWLQHEAGAFGAAQMTFQDVRMTFSCGSPQTTWRFYGRNYQDHLMDNAAFSLPHGRDFVCQLYRFDAYRTREHRTGVMETVYRKLSAAKRAKIDEWLKLQQHDALDAYLTAEFSKIDPVRSPRRQPEQSPDYCSDYA